MGRKNTNNTVGTKRIFNRLKTEVYKKCIEATPLPQNGNEKITNSKKGKQQRKEKKNEA
jgi:hypothetical protein